jgi:hypothetical protein
VAPITTRLCSALAAALALAACSGGPKPPESRIAMSACRLPGVEQQARCGRHEVFEDREASPTRS